MLQREFAKKNIVMKDTFGTTAMFHYGADILVEAARTESGAGVPFSGPPYIFSIFIIS